MRLDDPDFEPPPSARLLEKVYIPGPALSEAEVVSHHHGLRSGAFVDDPADEFLRGRSGELPGEGLNDGGVHPALLQAGELFLEGGHEGRTTLGRDNGERVRLKGEDGAPPSPPIRLLAD